MYRGGSKYTLQLTKMARMDSQFTKIDYKSKNLINWKLHMQEISSLNQTLLINTTKDIRA